MQSIQTLLTEALKRHARITRDYTLYNKVHIYPTNTVKARLREVCIPVAALFHRSIEFLTLNEYLLLARARKWDLSRDVNYVVANCKVSREDIARRLKRLYPNRATITEIAFPLSWDLGYTARTTQNAIERVSSYSLSRLNSTIAACKLLLYISKREKFLSYTDALDFEE